MWCTHMVETTLEAIRRLLTEALQECEDEECTFRLRAALQLLEAMQEEVGRLKADLEVFETVLEDHPELEADLRDLDAIDD